MLDGFVAFQSKREHDIYRRLVTWDRVEDGDSMSGKWLNVFNILVFAQFEM
jgi:hypothetical protein